MSEAADRFRERARECRETAATARDSYWRDRLVAIAAELEEEADRIDFEEKGG
jgi:hypothetical protein